MGNRGQPPRGGGTFRLLQIVVLPYEVNDRSKGIVPLLLRQGEGLGMVPLLFPWGVRPESCLLRGRGGHRLGGDVGFGTGGARGILDREGVRDVPRAPERVAF